MTTKERPTRVFSTIIEGKEELEDGVKLSLPGDAFKSDYPVMVYRVPPADAAKLKLKGAYNLRLQQGNVKKGKDGLPFLGTLPWQFYWNWVGVAVDVDAEAKGDDLFPETEKPHTTSTTPKQAGYTTQGHPDPRGAAIGRNVALKAAVEVFAALLEFQPIPLAEGVDPTAAAIAQVRIMAHEFAGFLGETWKEDSDGS